MAQGVQQQTILEAVDRQMGMTALKFGGGVRGRSCVADGPMISMPLMNYRPGCKLWRISARFSKYEWLIWLEGLCSFWHMRLNPFSSMGLCLGPNVRVARRSSQIERSIIVVMAQQGKVPPAV